MVKLLKIKMNVKKILRKFNRKFFNCLFILIYGRIKILKKENKDVTIQKIDKIDNLNVKEYNYKSGSFPITEHHCKNIISFPVDQHLTRNEMDYVIDTVNEFYEN